MTAPTVSIVMFCRNRHSTIARAIDSLCAQTYPHVEIVVQDGASTDGTTEILRGYGNRIRLVSAPDTGPGEAWLRCLRRCTGTYVGSCLSDEMLEADAVERAVKAFDERPGIDAIMGDAWRMDLDGNILGEYIGSPFDLLRYMSADYTPYFVSSFFRRSTLQDLGLMSETVDQIGLEAEIWVRVALNGTIAYVPGKFGYYALHPGQLSNGAGTALAYLRSRVALIDGLFAPGGFFDGTAGPSAVLRFGWQLRLGAAFYNHAVAVGARDLAEAAHEIALAGGRRLIAHLAGAPPGSTGLDLRATTETLMRAGIAVVSTVQNAPRPRRIALPPPDPALYDLLARRFEEIGRSDRAAAVLAASAIAR